MYELSAHNINTNIIVLNLNRKIRKSGSKCQIQCIWCIVSSYLLYFSTKFHFTFCYGFVILILGRFIIFNLQEMMNVLVIAQSSWNWVSVADSKHNASDRKVDIRRWFRNTSPMHVMLSLLHLLFPFHRLGQTTCQNYACQLEKNKNDINKIEVQQFLN